MASSGYCPSNFTLCLICAKFVLLSIRKLTRDNNYTTKFFLTHFEFQDSYSKKAIGNAKESSCGFLPVLVSQSSSDIRLDQIMLWHFRLGHPSFSYLKQLFLLLFINKDLSVLQCEACELAKHCCTPYHAHAYKPSHPFSIIHSDISTN